MLGFYYGHLFMLFHVCEMSTLLGVNNRINNRIYRRCESRQLEVDRADELGERQGQQPLQHRLPGQGWMVVVVE